MTVNEPSLRPPSSRPASSLSHCENRASSPLQHFFLFCLFLAGLKEVWVLSFLFLSIRQRRGKTNIPIANFHLLSNAMSRFIHWTCPGHGTVSVSPVITSVSSVHRPLRICFLVFFPAPSLGRYGLFLSNSSLLIDFCLSK